jgi:hydrogenase expression/formation protein HypC
MCLSVPVKILEIKNNKAVVEINGNKQGVGIDLIPEIRVNDYCLVSNGFVVKKISAKEAEEIFKILKPVKNEAKGK